MYLDFLMVGYVSLIDFKLGMIPHGCQVLRAPGKEVVQNDNVVTIRKEPLD
jgi:hypothetical protein